MDDSAEENVPCGRHRMYSEHVGPYCTMPQMTTLYDSLDEACQNIGEVPYSDLSHPISSGLQQGNDRTSPPRSQGSGVEGRPSSRSYPSDLVALGSEDAGLAAGAELSGEMKPKRKGKSVAGEDSEFLPSAQTKIEEAPFYHRSVQERHPGRRKAGRCFSLGICAMQTKIESKPMQAILKRLAMTGDFNIIYFSEELIVNESILKWPKVDCLITFFSTGFPLNKTIDYVQKVNPVVLNNVRRQQWLRNRSVIYQHLKEAGIPMPPYMVVDHDAVRRGDAQFEEHRDYIVYGGVRMDKPFIEKPVDADDHNNWIYYSKAAGGGCKKLFRKEQDRSSNFNPEISRIRRDGAYLYEKFVSTYGTDVKVYTVGNMFAHAEARKAPTLDGRVQRSATGKEVRYPVILSEDEKLFAFRIVEIFLQTVCGFDILRTDDGHSYICDVNGWSFVKGNSKYYTDCAHILRILFLSKLQERHYFIPRELPAEWFAATHPEEPQSILSENFNVVLNDMEGRELRTVVVLMRHGDRQPKQKLKFESSEPLFLKYWQQGDPSCETDATDNCSTPTMEKKARKEVKLKSADHLHMIASDNRVILDRLILEKQCCACTAAENEEEYLTDSSIASSSWGAGRKKKKMCPLDCHMQLQHVLDEGEGFAGINRKIQLKPIEWDDNGAVVRCLVVLKWGGALTDIGKVQAEQIGRVMRQTLYAGDPDGLLRLHSTFRHDLKIYTSDEGRCQLTAAAFAKGFLDLTGELTPILVQMVKVHKLLDDSLKIDLREHCKAVIDDIINQDVDFDEHPQIVNAILHGSQKCRDLAADLVCRINDQQRSRTSLSAQSSFSESPVPYADDATGQASGGKSEEAVIPTESLETAKLVDNFDEENRSPKAVSSPSTKATLVLDTKSKDSGSNSSPSSRDRMLTGMKDALSRIKNPYGRMEEIRNGIDRVIIALQKELDKWKLTSTWSHRSSYDVLKSIRMRWINMQDSWYKARTRRYDTSKVPDIADVVRFDVIHHGRHMGEALPLALNVLRKVEPLSSFITPSEYGISIDEKVEVATITVRRLLQKILSDVQHTLQEPPRLQHPMSSSQHMFLASAYRYRNPFSVHLRRGSDAQRSATKVQDGETAKNETDDPEEEEDKKEPDHIRLKDEDAMQMGIQNPWKIVRSRFYIASASHLQSMFNILLYGGKTLLENGVDIKDIVDPQFRQKLEKVTDVKYLSYVVIRVWEDPNPSLTAQERLKLTIEFNAGTRDKDIILPTGLEFLTSRGCNATTESDSTQEHQGRENPRENSESESRESDREQDGDSTVLPPFCKLGSTLPLGVDVRLSDFQTFGNSLLQQHTKKHEDAQSASGRSRAP